MDIRGGREAKCAKRCSHSDAPGGCPGRASHAKTLVENVRAVDGGTEQPRSNTPHLNVGGGPGEADTDGRVGETDDWNERRPHLLTILILGMKRVV